MELFLFPDGYGGLSCIENEMANLCFVVRKRTLHSLGGWAGLLDLIRNEVTGIRELLQGATACFARPLAISPIPYGYLGGPADGIWRVGDQIAVIPSFTGDGMSIALHSAALAAEMYLDHKSAQAYSRCLINQLRPGMRFACGLSRLMVTPAARMLAPPLLSLLPGAMEWIAASTRIPDRALVANHISSLGSSDQNAAQIA
jgi:flavin-dependent dehydrogenase